MGVDVTYAYAADITKVEKDPDTGDLMVYGKATGPDLDLDGQVCDPDWLKSAMPDWFEWGNVREMHQPIAAGVGVEMVAEGDDWYVTSKCIDPNTAKKIESKALRGYSVGIKDPKVVKDDRAPGGRIVGGTIVELSYVDRPCNPTAKMAIAKAVGADTALAPVEADAEDAEVTIKVAGSVYSPADLAKLLAKKVSPSSANAAGDAPAAGVAAADSSADDDKTDTEKPAKGKKGKKAKAAPEDVEKGAMPPLKPGGKPRYPINSVEDLKDAIQAFGRGKDSDKDEIKAHIKSEAKRLGRADLIPDDWKSTSKAADGDGADGMTHDPDDLASIRDALVAVINAELSELCDGEPELCDVEQLFCSLRMFMSWWSNEAYGGETTSPYGDASSSIDLAADAATPPTAPDVTKTATPEGVDTKTTDPTSGSVDEHDRLAELVKSAAAGIEKKLAKKVARKAALAKQATEERDALVAELTKTRAELDRLSALPEPGGPVLTRTSTQTAAARTTDADNLRAQANTLLKQAADVQATDPRLAQGYRDRANTLLKQAAA